MEKHIRAIHIDAYKGINNLTLPNLSSVNILTGDNNSGKTTILELLQIIDNPSQLSNWIPGARIQRYYAGDSALFEGILNLFPADRLEKHISFSYQQTDFFEEQHIEMNGTLFEDQLTEQTIREINGMHIAARDVKNNAEMQYRDVRGIHLEMLRNGEQIQNVDFYDFQSRVPRGYARHSSVTYLSPYVQEEYYRYLDDVLSDSAANEELIQLLQIFDPDITGIQAVRSGEYLRSVRYLVVTKAHNQALPLNAYGDGMKKAVCLFGALIRAKNGILLIDEFETGIHTNAMNKMFEVLLVGAKRLNVQVFLTSHSKEAISKILHVSPQMQAAINLYTLYRYDGQNLVRYLTAEQAIHASDKLGLELR